MRALVAMVLLGLPLAARAQDQARERERFLHEAEVVSDEVIGTGITLPRSVELVLGSERRRAVFKSVEIYLEEETVRIADELQEGLRDSWKFEVAAYELDKLLGLGMVPVTVARRIGGREGALIDWVEGVLPEFRASPEGFRIGDWEEQIRSAWLFDYLAYNIDRTVDNLLVVEGFRVKLIDHSRSFQRFLTPMRVLERFPRVAIERLRRLGDDDFREELAPYLDGKEMGALLERRKRILERVEDLLRSRRETDVLFD